MVSYSLQLHYLQWAHNHKLRFTGIECHQILCHPSFDVTEASFYILLIGVVMYHLHNVETNIVPSNGTFNR